ncbi:MAG TPA: R3H domain-containing nucleic acid-binding protein [Thermomicrobiales bacterium]|nr:R3H domain-containing nucleic acid-binding protein [Thermomicrobiales bacterium]
MTLRTTEVAQEGFLGGDRELSRPPYELASTDNLDVLLAVLPARISEAVAEAGRQGGYDNLVEIVMDLGRRPEARFQSGELPLTDREVDREDLAFVAERIGAFGADNRAGIERTLHRISAIRNRSGEIVGLTCRVGRAVFGTIAIMRDLIESGQSVLLLGRPGVGKTTLLRETARVLADELHKRVVVVDTSNEIAGDGDIPHPAIGRARRMQVPTPTDQHGVMIEAVENHMPQVVVIDEIGTELEAMAARTIAERGVQLIGTAHGNSLENLMMNPTLADLIGGIQSVTLSDEEARRRGTQKSILERKAPPTFDTIIEIIDRDHVAVHNDVASTVDLILRGGIPRPELRRREEDGEVAITAASRVESAPVRQNGRGSGRGLSRDQGMYNGYASGENGAGAEGQSTAPAALDPLPAALKRRGTDARPLRIYAFGVSRNRLEHAIEVLRVPATVVRDAREADIVLTLKNYFRQRAQPIRDAESRGVPVYVLRSNTGVQMEQLLSTLFPSRSADEGPIPPDWTRSQAEGVRPAPAADDPLLAAISEAEEAISSVIEGGPPVQLAPQVSRIRQVQHQLAERYALASRSRGREPHRRVEISRDVVG